MKAAADGYPEFAGKLYAPEDLLAKAGRAHGHQGPERTKGTVTVELPKNMSLSVKPSDLAKLATLRQKLARDQGANKAAAPSVTKAAEPDAAKASREFSTERREELASQSNALPDGSYPIPDADALRRAAILARSKHGNWKAARKLIARRAREALGVPNPLKSQGREDRHPGRRQVRLQRRDDGRQALHLCKAGKRMAKTCQEGHRARARPRGRASCGPCAPAAAPSRTTSTSSAPNAAASSPRCPRWSRRTTTSCAWAAAMTWTRARSTAPAAARRTPATTRWPT